MEFPPFPLSPLDDGKPLGRVPRAVARVEVDGQSWILRPCNGLLFARREDQNSQEWTWIVAKPLPVSVPIVPPPLFSSRKGLLNRIKTAWTQSVASTTSPQRSFDELPTSAEQLTLMWREALENNWVARFALSGNVQMESNFPYFFCSDGTGFVREFCNREDFPFDWKEKQQTAEDVWTCSLRHFQHLANWNSDDLYQAMNENWNFQDEPLHFLCGSENELQRLCRFICHSEDLFFNLDEPIDIEICGESGFARAGLTEIGSETYFWYRSDTAIDKWGCAGWPIGAPPRRVQRLFEMAIDQNTPAGLHWEYRDQDSGRASVTPDAIAVRFSISPPSQHEHLEAKLELRDWLKSRVSPEELQELLGE